MNYRETFENRFGGVIETCSGDVLEAFDWLIDQLEEADRLRDQLRKRVWSLENENNVLKTLGSADALTEENVDDLDEAISSLEGAAQRMLALKAELDSVKELCETVLVPVENVIRARKEYEDALASITAQVTPAQEQDDEEPPVIVIKEEPEPVADEPEDQGNEDFFFTSSSDAEISDITEKLRVLVLDDGETEVKEPEPEPKLSEEEDISNIIFKYFSEEPARTEPSADEFKEDISEPVETEENMAEIADPQEEAIGLTDMEKDYVEAEEACEDDISIAEPSSVVEEELSEESEDTLSEKFEANYEQEANDEPASESYYAERDAQIQKEQKALDDIITAFTLQETVKSEEETVYVKPSYEQKKPEDSAPKSELQSIRASLADIKNKRKK